MKIKFTSRPKFYALKFFSVLGILLWYMQSISLPMPSMWRMGTIRMSSEIKSKNYFDYPCGEGFKVDTYIKGLTNGGTFVVPNPEGDVAEVVAEVWMTECPGGAPATINIGIGSNTVAAPVEIIDSPTPGEHIYRASYSGTFNSGGISVTPTSFSPCEPASMAIYVRRTAPVGSAALVVSNQEALSGGCIELEVSVGTSDGPRDITVYVPIHEKADDGRVIDISATAGSASDQVSISGNDQDEVALVTLTLDNVEGDEEIVIIEACSPQNNGSSIGIGGVSASSVNCNSCTLDDAGTISSDQGNCGAFTPVTLIGEDASPSGVIYQWQSRVENEDWSDISEADQRDYAPLELSVTREYRRLARLGQDCEWQPSNIVTLTVFSSPSVDAGADVDIYEGQSANLVATPSGFEPFAFSWSDGLGAGASVIAFPEVTTTFTVTVTDANGCTAIDFVTISVNAIPDECTTNLIDNWSFENGLTSWDVNGFVSREDNRYNQFGDWYVYLYYDGSPATISQQVENVVPGELYTLNFFGGTHDNHFEHLVEMAFYDADGIFLGGETVEVDFVVGCCNYSVNYPMEYYTLEATAPVNAASLKIMAINNGGDYLKLDGICVDGLQCILPNAAADEYSLCAENEFLGNVGDNDIFPNGSVFQISEGPSSGSVEMAANGNFSYQPDPGFGGMDEFVYEVCNTSSCCTTATVSVVVESLPSLVISADTTVCAGETVPLFVDVRHGDAPFSINWSGNLGSDATVSVSPLESTIYSVSVTDANGCLQAAEVMVEVREDMSMEIDIIAPNCGMSDGQISGTPINTGEGDCLVYRLYDYNLDRWVSGYQEIPLFENLPAGRYRIKKWVDPNCDGNYEDETCYQRFPEDELELIDADGPNVTFETTDVNCNGDDDGSIILSVEGGTPPLSFLWDTGDEVEVLNGLAGGEYSVTVTDANGCEAVSIIEIEEPELLLCTSIIPTNPSGAGFTNGSVDVTVSGGTAPYSYEWNTGVQSQDLIGVGAGTYSVTITDDNGCQTSCSATVNEPSAISCEVTAEAVSCYEGEDGGLEVTGSGGSGVYEYSLNETDYTTNNSFTGLSAGIYTIFVRDANETAAVSSCQVEIPEPSELLVEQTGRAISCNGLTDGEIDLTVSGGTAPYSYLWSTGSSAEDQAELSAGSYHRPLPLPGNSPLTALPGLLRLNPYSTDSCRVPCHRLPSGRFLHPSNRCS